MGNRAARLIRSTLVSTFAAAGLLVGANIASADPAELTVHVDRAGPKMDPMFYGLMTEEINHSYDGGLYGELIQNRAFLDTPPAPNRGGRGGRGRGTSGPATQPEPVAAPTPPTPANYLMHWSAVSGADISVVTDAPVNTTALPHSLQVTVGNLPAGGHAGVANDGYWGFPIRPNTTYSASFFAKGDGPLTVSLESADGATVFATGTVASINGSWKKYDLQIKTGADVRPTADARFAISSSKPGKFYLSLVSLFPPTYQNRVNGNRIDLMQMLADMKPAFLRFPGGNYVEGRNFENRFAWKATVGPLDQRPGHQSPWNYRSSDGFGLYEFLMWAEELKMEPVLAVYAGLHLDQGRTTLTGDALKPFVQEALEEIEYVTGDVSTTWGAQRAKDGHPAPFKLTYVEIGNEDNLNNGMQNYDGRFTMFYDAIKAKYPNLQIISTVPSSNRNFARTRKPDVIDDHYYMTIAQSLSRAHTYDNYDRSSSRIFVGEWATREPRNGQTPNLGSAVADGAWLTGLERNCDVVIMNCYAPLLVNVNPGGMQWNVDLIGFDTLSAYGSPSYYTQKMFAGNRGDSIIPTELTPTVAPTEEKLFAVANHDSISGDIILKIVNAQTTAQQVNIKIDGAANINASASGEVMSGDPNDVNSIAEPTKVSPKPISIANAGKQFSHEVPASSVTVIRLKTR